MLEGRRSDLRSTDAGYRAVGSFMVRLFLGIQGALCLNTLLGAIRRQQRAKKY
jgi:hypothetical protein